MIQLPENINNMDKDEVVAILAPQLEQLASDYYLSFYQTVGNLRLLDHVYTRDGVQKYAWIQFLIQLLTTELEAAMNCPGTFYTEEERQLASTQYDECQNVDVAQIQRGYKAAWEFMQAIHWLMSTGDDQMSSVDRLEVAQSYISRAFKTRIMPPGKNILTSSQERKI